MYPPDDKSPLPTPLRDLLDRIADGYAAQADVDALVAGLGELPLQSYDAVARELGWRANLPDRFLGSSSSRTFAFWRARRTPVLVWLQLFHHSGYVREGALRAIEGSAPNAFMIVALVYRVNDWVPQVRAAASEALERVARVTETPIVAQAVLHLLTRCVDWARWEWNRGVFDALLDRPEVARVVAATIGASLQGPQARVLRQALRRPVMDAFLPTLLKEARQPSVRSLALRTLADGKVILAFGPPTERKWIDKSMGRFTFARKTVERCVASPFTLTELIRIGADDRSAAVRLAAATALSLNFAEGPAGRALAERLATDKSRAVRERAAFLLR